MNLRNRGSNNGISNPLPNSDFFISESDRLFGENFATGEYYRRKQENEKKKERYKIRQNEQHVILPFLNFPYKIHKTGKPDY